MHFSDDLEAGQCKLTGGTDPPVNFSIMDFYLCLPVCGQLFSEGAKAHPMHIMVRCSIAVWFSVL